MLQYTYTASYVHENREQMKDIACCYDTAEVLGSIELSLDQII